MTLVTTHASAQAPPTPVVATVEAVGFSSADSTQVLTIVRSALERDSMLRVVHRPPPDSLRYLLGRPFEVARIAIATSATRVGTHLTVAIAARDVVARTEVLRTTISTPVGSSNLDIVASATRAFAQQLAVVTR